MSSGPSPLNATASADEGPADPHPLRLLFVCVENSCRSQMAEAFARELGGRSVEAHSAGSRPSGRVDPRTISFMAELGLDLSSHRSTSVDELTGASFDAVVSMGCGDACPHVAARRRVDWDVPNPKEMPAEAFRGVRDEIRSRVGELIEELDADRAGVQRHPGTPLSEER